MSPSWVKPPGCLDHSRARPTKNELEDCGRGALHRNFWRNRARSCSARFAILLDARGAQTREAVDLESALPGKELPLRQLVDTAGLLDRNATIFDRSDHLGLATDYPSFDVRRRQIIHERCPVQGRRGEPFHQTSPQGRRTDPLAKSAGRPPSPRNI